MQEGNRPGSVASGRRNDSTTGENNPTRETSAPRGARRYPIPPPARARALPTAAPSLRLLDGFFGFRHSGDATHASGRQGVRDAEANWRFAISTTLVRRYARIRAVSAAYVREFCWKSLQKNSLRWCFRRRADRARKKRRRPPPQRAAVAGVCPSGHGGCFKLH